MTLTTCTSCGILVNFETCKDLYSVKEDYYGEYTKCPNCLNCLYECGNSKVPMPFEDEN
jgi:hypothetical protein